MESKPATFLSLIVSMSAVKVLLLLMAAGGSVALSEDLQTTAAPPILTASLSMEKPKMLPLHRPCGSEHDGYCANDGVCMYPQDSNKLSCICTSQYTGPRCMLLSTHSQSHADLEKVIAISFGVLMTISILAIIVYFCMYKRCVRETPLKNSTISQTLV